MMMKLFALYIGGEHARANIELHDMRFVVARSVRDTYNALRAEWWGTPDSLHLDAWAALDHADGHDIVLEPEPFSGDQKLYYVNLGGYDARDFIEHHKNVFVVARTLADAKARAINVNRGWKQLHRYDVYEAEQAFSLADVAREQRLYIHLVPTSLKRDLKFTCKYTALKKRVPSSG